jgi:uncharacterized membrane protein
MNPKSLEALIWVLIYGGLIALCLGFAVSSTAPATGTALSIGGGIVAAIGAVLIVVRSRMKGD